MVAIVRVGDMSTGDPCGAPPRAAMTGASKTFINGKAIHRMGDSWQPHPCPESPPHEATTTMGSTKLIVEGMGAARVGDPISCGSTCAQGSGNTEGS